MDLQKTSRAIMFIFGRLLTHLTRKVMTVILFPPFCCWWITVGLRIRKSLMSLIKHLRLDMKNTATNCMPEVVSDLPYDFKKILESCPSEL